MGRKMLAVIACALALAGTGCSSGTKAATNVVGYSSDKPPVTITFWYMPYGGEMQDQAVIKETQVFHQEHPNITVKLAGIDWNDALTRLSTASTSGNGPDVTQLGTTWVAGFSALGDLRPYTSAELAAVGGQSAFVPASWTSSHALGSSTITGMPWLMDIRALIYRTDVLKAAGLDPTTAFATWASFQNSLARIKASGTKVAPLAIGLSNNFGIIHNVAPFVWDNGGDLLSADGRTSLLAKQNSVTAVSYYQRLIALYDDPKAIALDSSVVPAAFANGTGAITIDNSQSVADFLSNPNRPGLKAGWSTALMPAGPVGRYGFLGGSNLAILKNSKQPDAAFEWVKFLTSKESQSRYGVDSGLWPARADAVAGTRLATDPKYAAFRQMLAVGRQYPSVPAWITIESVIAKDFANLWSARTPLAAAQVANVLNQTSADIDAAIKQPVTTPGS